MKNIHFLNLSSYTAPKITESTRLGWVEYGEKNDYFKYLIDRYNGSATNNAILNGIVEMLYGRGLDAVDAARKPDQYAQMKALLSKKTNRRALSDLKMLGQCALQIIYSVDRSRITEVHHLPIETIRSGKVNESGEVEGYYYSKNWEKVGGKNKPEFFAAFGTSNNPTEIFYIKPYRSGYYYYAPVDYQGGLPYAELEEEVASYHINNIQHGLAPSMIVNFNNGVPSDEDQTEMERRINQKFSGSGNAGRMILAFNDNKESQATIEPVQLSDASQQYEFLADESMRKLMVAHRVTSPMLLGIKDNSGLGNNAEELETASLLFDNTVIRPIQELYIDGLEQILAYNDISLNLFFRSLQPLAFKSTEIPKEELSAAMPELKITEDLESLGEIEDAILEDYEMLDAEDVGDEPEGFDAEAYINGTQLAAQEDSVQDTDRFKVRYAYTKGTRKSPKDPSRELCKRLVAAGRVYRKEDIWAMSSKGGAEDKGQQYSVWLYKGGVNCYHRWERRIYRKKLNKEGLPYGGGALNGTEKVNVNQAIRQGFKPVKNSPRVAEAQIDRTDKGHK